MAYDYDYINKAYGLNVKKGSRCKFQGEPGTVIASTGDHLKVKLDNGKLVHVHPTWEMEYL